MGYIQRTLEIFMGDTGGLTWEMLTELAAWF
jgi:hypothetical protein